MRRAKSLLLILLAGLLLCNMSIPALAAEEWENESYLVETDIEYDNRPILTFVDTDGNISVIFSYQDDVSGENRLIHKKNNVFALVESAYTGWDESTIYHDEASVSYNAAMDTDGNIHLVYLQHEYAGTDPDYHPYYVKYDAESDHWGSAINLDELFGGTYSSLDIGVYQNEFTAIVAKFEASVASDDEYLKVFIFDAEQNLSEIRTYTPDSAEINLPPRIAISQTDPDAIRVFYSDGADSELYLWDGNEASPTITNITGAVVANFLVKSDNSGNFHVAWVGDTNIIRHKVVDSSGSAVNGTSIVYPIENLESLAISNAGIPYIGYSESDASDGGIFKTYFTKGEASLIPAGPYIWPFDTHVGSNSCAITLNFDSHDSLHISYQEYVDEHSLRDHIKYTMADLTAPESITSNSNTYVSVTSPILSWNCEDYFSGIDKYLLSLVDSSETPLLDEEIVSDIYHTETGAAVFLSTAYPAELAEGTYTWKVTAIDNAENSTTSEDFDLIVDLTAPNISAISTDPESPSNSENVDVTLTVEDPESSAGPEAVSGITAAYLCEVEEEGELDGVALFTLLSEDSDYDVDLIEAENADLPAFKLDNLSDGWNYLVFYVKDEAGNETQSTHKIFVDTDEPSIYVSDCNIDDGDYLSLAEDLKITIDGEVEDRGTSSGIAEITASILNGETIVASVSETLAVEPDSATGISTLTEANFDLELETTGLESGITYTLQVLAKDCAGNEKTDERTFIASDAPVVTITDPTVGSTSNVSNVELVFTVAAGAASIDTVIVYVNDDETDDPAVLSTDDAYHLTLTLPDGENIIEVTATDLVGISGTDSVDVLVDTVKPVIDNINATVDPTSLATTISITALDETSGIMEIEVSAYEGASSDPTYIKVFNFSEPFPTETTVSDLIPELTLDDVNDSKTIRFSVKVTDVLMNIEGAEETFILTVDPTAYIDTLVTTDATTTVNPSTVIGSITLTVDPASQIIGESVTCTATVYNEFGDEIVDTEGIVLTWDAGDAGTVSVIDNTTAQIAVENPGNHTVKVSGDGVEAEQEIEVTYAEIEAVRIIYEGESIVEGTTISISVSDSVELEVALEADGEVIDNVIPYLPFITWTYDSEELTPDGKVVTINGETTGTKALTVAYENSAAALSNTINIETRAGVTTQITVNPEGDLVIEEGNNIAIEVNYQDAFGNVSHPETATSTDSYEIGIHEIVFSDGDAAVAKKLTVIPQIAQILIEEDGQVVEADTEINVKVVAVDGSEVKVEDYGLSLAIEGANPVTASSANFTVDSKSDGGHEVSASLTTSLRTISGTGTIHINNSAPTLTVKYKNNEVITAGAILDPTVVVNVEAYDASGITTDDIKIYFNEVEVNSSEISSFATAGESVSSLSVTYTAAEALTEGTYTLKVTATDIHGKMTEEIISGIQIYDSIRVLDTPMNYPNPVGDLLNGGTTTIHYTLSQDTDVQIKIYTMTGELVHNEFCYAGAEGGQAGENNVAWDGKTAYGTTIGNGVYLFMIVSDGKLLAQGEIAVFHQP